MAIIRLPLSQPLETRDGTLTKDSLCSNGYFDTQGPKRDFVKRIGLTSPTLQTVLPPYPCKGLTYFKGYLYVVLNNVIYKVNPLTYTQVLVGTMTGAIANCYFTSTSQDAYLFVHNQTNGYLINGTTGAFTQLTNDNVTTPCITILTGGTGYTTPTVTFSPPTIGVAATGTVQVTSGVVTGITITNPGSGYTSAPSITINPVGGGSSATASCILNFFPTGGLVPGAVFIDSYIVVGQANGRLYNCNVGDPTTWNALNYVSAEGDPDFSIGIVKHYNYIVNYGSNSTEYFYDAGNAITSPFSPAQSYRSEIGCSAGDSIVQFENTVAWVGSSKSAGEAVYLLDGLTPTRISNAYVDRILNSSTLARTNAYAFKNSGHTFYVLTLFDLNITLVCDIQEKAWYRWTSWAVGTATSGVADVYAEQYFRPAFYTSTLTGADWFSDGEFGTLSYGNSTTYTDSGAPIYFRSTSDIIDHGSSKRKFYHRLEIIGDKVQGSLQVRHSQDDYKTWSQFRTVDLSKSRPQIYSLGTARRRAWQFLCTDAVPLRIDSAEIDYEVGELEQEGIQAANYRK